MIVLINIGLVLAGVVAGIMIGIFISKPRGGKKDIDWVNDDMAQ